LILLVLLIVLRRILLVGIDISFLLLAGLPGLSSLSGLSSLPALLTLPLLATLLLIFFHIVCHVHCSILCRTRLGALLRVYYWRPVIYLVAIPYGRVGNNLAHNSLPLKGRISRYFATWLPNFVILKHRTSGAFSQSRNNLSV
jgi:hypothetical protein